MNRTASLKKLDGSSVSKDGKTEAVHGLLEQQQTLCLLEILYAASNGRKCRGRQASVNSDVVLNAFAVTSHVSLNYRYVPWNVVSVP